MPQRADAGAVIARLSRPEAGANGEIPSSAGIPSAASVAATGLRVAVAVLLGGWLLLSAWITVTRLGTVISAPGAPAGAVGLPMPGAESMPSLLAILSDAAGPALVILPPSTPPLRVDYLDRQLARALYPIRVDAVGGGRRLPPVPYTYVVAAPGVLLRRPWRPDRVFGGFTRYVRQAQ